jgi:hypothetical protein
MKGLRTFVASSLLARAVSAHPSHEKRTLPFGTVIYSCTVANTVALTFDDGPYIYTDTLLTELEAAGHRATFFQNGQNYDNIYSYNNTLKRMISGNHQVCSHTWSHADLTTLTDAGIAQEMQELEVAFNNIIGKIPTYMRPVCLHSVIFIIVANSLNPSHTSPTLTTLCLSWDHWATMSSNLMSIPLIGSTMQQAQPLARISTNKDTRLVVV